MITRLAIHAVILSLLTFSLSFAEDASPAELLKAGDEAFAKKEFSVAADKYSVFLEKNAKDKQAPSVHLKLSDALIAAGLPLRASTNYEALLREHADSKEAVKGRFLLGKTHEARGDFLRAIAQYKQYMRRYPKEPNVNELRQRIPAIYEDVLGKWKDATREWLAFVKQYPRDAKAAEALDHAAWLTEYRLRRPKQAVELYAKVVKEYPRYKGRQKAQGRLAYLCEDGGIRDYQRAVQEYRNYIKWYPKADDLYEKIMRLAYMLRHRVNQQANAVEAYKAALKIKPNPGVAYDLAYSYYAAGDRKTAVAEWKEFIAKYPEDYRVHSAWQYMRDRLWELKEKEETLKVAAEVCQKYPKDVGDHWTYAYRLRDMKQYAKSNELFYKCEEIQPGYQNGHLYELIAGNFLYLEDVAGAEKAVKASFQKMPDNADVFVRGHWSLGTSIYPKQKKTQEATKALEALCVKYPDHAHWPNPDHSLPRIESYYRTLKKPADAFEAFNRIYQSHPNSKNARFARVYAVRALTEARQFDKALAEAKAIIDENMDDDPWGWASIEYGVALGAKGDTIGQLEAFAIMPVIRDRSGFGYSRRNVDHYRGRIVNKLLGEAKKKADDPQSQLVVALCLHANGDLAGATKAYAALLATEDLDPNLKATAERAKGEALALQNRADDIEPDLEELKVPQLIALGNSYERQKRYHKALDAFEALRKKMQNDRYPHLRIAQIYDRNRQFEKAIDAYLNLLERWPNEKDNQQNRRRINDICFSDSYWDNQPRGRELCAQLFESQPDPHIARAIYYSYTHRTPVDYKIALEWALKYANHPDAEPGDSGAQLMDAYHRVKKYEEAAQYGQQWVGKHRQHTYALNMMYRTAEAFRHTPQRERALPVFRMIVSRWPKSNEALESTLRCYDIPGPHRIPMLQQWVQANPDHYRVAEFKYRIGLVHAYEKRPDEAVKAYRDVWQNHRTKWAENMYCSWNMAEIYRRQNKHAEARKVYEEVIDHFGANPHHQIRHAWARLLQYYIEAKRPKNEIKEFCGRLVPALANTYEIISPLTSLSEIYEEEGDYLESAIALQKLILLSPKKHDSTWNKIKELIDKKMEAGRYGESAMLYRALARNNTGYKKERVQDVEKAMATALGKSGAGFAAIDSKLEEAGLLWGNVFAQAGEEELAWQKYLDSKKLFKKYMHLIHPEFIKIVVSRMIFEKEIAHAINYCRLFMVKHMDNKNMSSQSKGEVQILLGDCYFRDERFDIARDEYATVVNIFDGTAAATDARFKIGQTLMAQKIYTRGEEIFETLATTSRDEQVIARANLMLGILYHTMGEPKKAEKQFKTVLALNPRHDTADQIIYRLGIVYHQRGRYKEALDTLKLIGAYSGESKRQVAPGTELRIRLSDRNLNLTRGAADVPIIVEVTNEDGSKGDIEKIFLTRSQAGAGLFVGGLFTALGEPEKNDNILQINGASTISYRYDPVFAQDFILSEDDRGMEQVVRVADDAILQASATEIKDEEIEEVDPDMFNKEEGRDGERLFRDELQLKPGNPLYLRVKDGDRDRNDAADTIEVMVSSASGDSVAVKLEETGAHTGEFRGQVGTALRPADTLASDSAEGHEARFAIDGSKDASKAWIGRMDGRSPKWLAADLKEVFKVNKFSFHRGEGFKEDEERRILRYDLLASKNRKEWDLIASHPQTNALVGAKVVWDPDGQYTNWGNKILEANGNRESRWRGKQGVTEWVIDIDLGKTFDIARTNLRPHNTSYETRRYNLYVEKEAGDYPGQKRGLDGWKVVYESEGLSSPKDDIHDFEEGKAVGRYIRIVVKDKFHRYPEIGEFEISPRTNFELTETEDKAGATITFPTIETRFLKLVIREFKDDAPAIAELKVFGPDDKLLLPPDIDVHQLATNNILEISPGDTITATYTDEKNIYPGEPNTLRESLSATFYNGTIKAIRHYFFEDENGNRHKRDFDVYRVEAGERFIVQITDYDADKTDGIDRVPFTVHTSSGAMLKLEASETDLYTGVFVKEVDTSADEQPDALFLKEGDSILLSYWDEENTFPGNRTERRARLFENVPTRGMVLIADEQIQYHRIPKYDPESIGQVKLLAPEKKLYIAVYDPDAATDGNSKVKVKLKTSPGGAEVEIECEFRYHYYRRNWENEWRQMWGGPEHKLPGLFLGQIELALGDKDSPAFKIEAFQFHDSALTTSKRKKETTQVPVLNAMGSDTITALYIDNAVPDNPLAEEREDLARLITDANFGFYDSEYEERVETAHLGEKLYLFVDDPDRDTSEGRDEVPVFLETNKGDKLIVKLRETLSHSGQFTLPLALAPVDPDPENDKLEAQFGTIIYGSYEDMQNTQGKGPTTMLFKIPVVTGTDGTLMAFSRKYPDGDMAVETEFKIGECNYYLGRALIKNKQKKSGLRHLSEGQNILTELIVHHPDAEYLDEATYLLGNVAQERESYFDAIRTYRQVIMKWPESPVAADAQYKTAMCLEKLGRFTDACEEYVRLAYQFPQSALVSDSMIRIGLYYFNRREYDKASSVFERFVSKYPDHEQVEKVGFKQGLCYILSGNFVQAGDHFKAFAEAHPSSDMKPAALYWSGDAYLKGNQAKEAYVQFKTVVWRFPDEKWAKYARGRLTAPVFDRIAEDDTLR